MRSTLHTLVAAAFLSFFFTLVHTVFAGSVHVGSIQPPEWLDTETRQIHVEVTINSTGSAYLQAVFALGTSTNYFGCTKNNANLFVCKGDSSDYTKYYKVTGPGTYELTVKPDTRDSGYKGTGDYNLKVLRYTSSGSYASSENMEPVHIIATTPEPGSSAASPTQSAAATQFTSGTPTSTDVPQPLNIWLSEFSACPESGEKEWVEVLNGNDAEVTLENWKLQDGSTTKKTFSLTIPAKGYVAIGDLSFSLNNDGDSVQLFNGKNEKIDDVTYTACEKGASWAKFSQGWRQTASITKGSINAFRELEVSTTPTASATSTQSPTNTPTMTINPTFLFPSAYVSTQSATISGTILGMETDPQLVSDSKEPYPRSISDQTIPNINYSAFAAIGTGTVMIAGAGGYLGYGWYNERRKRNKI